MAAAIKVPDLGTTVDTVKLVSWLVREGDSVKRGDALAEIQTDKATSDLESVAEGMVLKILVPADSTVEKGAVLAYVGQAGEAIPEGSKPAQGAQSAVASSAPVAAKGQGVKVAPVVRNLAEKLGVDLSKIQGTGQGGMITREDVLAASKADAAASGETLSRVQSAVAKAVLRSVQTMPHLRVNVSLDMTAAGRLREAAKNAGKKLSYDAIVLKALAGAIRDVPLVAAKLDGERIVRPKGIHIAIAVDRGGELYLPVVRDVDKKDLSALQRDIEDFAQRAEKGAIKPEEMTGGCMTLSNLGMYLVESFAAIIFPEHSAILALGAALRKPVAVGEKVEIRSVATATLAADHRLINGRTAAEFLSRLKEILESGSF